MAALVIGLANSFVRPILKLLTAPLNCMTFGLFGFALNAFLFFVVQFVVPGFKVESAVAALFGSLAMGALSSLLNSLLSDKPRAA
jgi:putative membrane protein